MQMFTHEELLISFRKGQRNGNWHKLSKLEKALYMASLWYSKVQGAIINLKLERKLSVLVEKLKVTPGARVFKRGFERNMDFTLTKYGELCKAIVDSGCAPVRVCTYLEAPPDKCIIIRHDIDRNPEKALKMAELENTLGITSTYYFRKREDVFIPALIKKIADMGHEIGYHYEVMDKAEGDFEKAIRIFEAELKEFRNICDVKTISMHGNPLSKWLNKDLWKEYDFGDFDIIGEPYLSIDYTKVRYLTDTSRRWNSKFSVKDVVGANSQRDEKITSTDDVIRLINNTASAQICILTHPNRWSDSFGAWLKELAWQNMKNVGKAILVKRSSAHDKNKK